MFFNKRTKLRVIVDSKMLLLGHKLFSKLSVGLDYFVSLKNRKIVKSTSPKIYKCDEYFR